MLEFPCPTSSCPAIHRFSCVEAKFDCYCVERIENDRLQYDHVWKESLNCPICKTLIELNYYIDECEDGTIVNEFAVANSVNIEITFDLKHITDLN